MASSEQDVSGEAGVEPRGLALIGVDQRGADWQDGIGEARQGRAWSREDWQE